MKHTQSVIFWGAGATKALGIRTTLDQTRFIKCITDTIPLEERISKALDPNDIEPWHSALFDLITILGDGDEAHESIDFINDRQLNAMGRNWHRGAKKKELRRRIIALRLIYDWPALKSVVSVCPGSSETFKLNDLFNLFDMHIPPGFGFRAPVHRASGTVNGRQEQFFDARRLIGAKNALLMILAATFYIDYQVCIHLKSDDLRKYYDFAILLGRRMQNHALNIGGHYRFDEPEFYKADVGFVSLNYDPILLWMQFNANRDLNKSPAVPHLGLPAVPLHLFHDFGHLIPARRIGRGEADWPWYPMNEAATQRLNEQKGGSCKVMLTKFLFPHGCLCWRECPDCGKLSAYHGDQWGLDAFSLFPPPPLLAFDIAAVPHWIFDEERFEREKGNVDARKCLHCGTLTYLHHTQVVMQSSFKPQPPSFIEEIQRDLRATVMHADHIIFMGYSLPPDDVNYRAFFAARRQRQAGGDKSQAVHCTVIGKEDAHPAWYGPNELKMKLNDFPQDHPVRTASDIFGKSNVRFYGGGIPEVFLEGHQVTATALERLLNWS